MRKLTFLGFLEKYVQELADFPTLNIKKLYEMVSKGNYRLKEPLFLYCIYAQKCNVLYKYANDADKNLIADVASKINAPDTLGSDFFKVYEAYNFQCNKHNNELRIKSLMLDKIRNLQKEKSVTSYRVYTHLKINAGNYNAFVKNNALDKLGINKCREVLQYLESI